MVARWVHVPKVGSSNLSSAIFTLLLWREFKTESEWIKIILISKEIAHKLNKDFGVPFGENGISSSKTNHKKYYLCESRKNLSLLKKLEK